MGKNLIAKNKIKNKSKIIIIKGDETKIYDEVIFFIKNKSASLFLADKLINKYKLEYISKLRLISESLYYISLFIFALVIFIKIMRYIK